MLILACTLGASSAYMMPVGTPPERDRVRDRARADAADDEGRLLAEPRGILVITALTWLFIAPLLGNVD